MKNLVLKILMVFSFSITLIHFSSCSETSVILQIGDIVIPKYIVVEGLKSHLNKISSNDKQSKSIQKCNEWLKDFIDKQFIVAAAYENGYLSRNDVLEEASAILKKYYAQPSVGPLYKKLVRDQIKITANMIDEVKQRRNKRQYITYFHFNDSTQINHLLSNKSFSLNSNNIEDFYIKCEKKLGMYRKEGIFIWGLPQFWEYRRVIYFAKPGEVKIHQNESNEIFIFKVNREELIQQNKIEDHVPIELIDKNIRKTLFRNEEQQILNKFFKNVFKIANIQIKQDNLAQIFSIYSNTHIIEHTFIDTTKFQNYLDKEIFKFYLNDSIKKVTIRMMIRFYNQSLIRFYLENEQSIVELCKNFVSNDYAYGQAKKFGLLDTKDYIFDKEHIINLVASQKYVEDQIINIKEAVKLKYEEKKNYFVASDWCTVDILYFVDRESSIRAFINLKNGKDISQFKNLVKVDSNIILSFDSEMFDKTIINKCFNSPIGSIHPPINFKENFSVIMIKKSEGGKRYIEFEKVKLKIKNMVLEGKKNELISQLKGKYKIHNLIDDIMMNEIINEILINKGR